MQHEETREQTTVLRGGVLTLAATPIGNPLDASVRLRLALAEAEVIAAEDTRRLSRLCASLNVRYSARVFSHHEHNEEARTQDILAALANGEKVLIVTDAGMPVVSDPGYRAVRAAVAAGYEVDVLPGPSAPLTALAASGLAPDRFTFEGFLPRKEGKRAAALSALAQEPRTMLFFESPRRLSETLAAAAEAFGADRQAAVCRELTKTFQEVVRLPLGQLAAWAEENEVLGEIVLVVSGAPQDAEVSLAELAQRARQIAHEDGVRLKEAAKRVAAQHRGVKASEVYDLAR
ncbi:16S rRNA (cytidine(1402)-2'-O)-methyltransferase [Dermabacteraceae bacterium CCM 9520]